MGRPLGVTLSGQASSAPDTELQTAAGGRPRLNPLAFPTDTDFRLLLLIAAVVGSGLFIYNWIYFDLPGFLLGATSSASCSAQVHGAGSASVALTSACQGEATWMLAGVGLIFVVAFALFIVAPEVKLRRQRLVPLMATDAPGVTSALNDLLRTAAVRSSPEFVWDPLNGSAVGLAFGRKGRYFVALTGGLVTRFYADRPAFESVVLHELGHLKNGDVDKTYLAIAIWQAFVAVALVPLAATVILSPSLRGAMNDAWILGWRALALTALVYLARNSILRSREMYADLRAALWHGSGTALIRALGTRDSTAARSRWRTLLLTHPTNKSRREALADSAPLFTVSPWTALAAGLAAGIAYPSVAQLFLLVFTNPQSNIWYWTTPEVGALLESVVLGMLIAGVLGIGLWRMAFASAIQLRRSRAIAHSAGATIVGIGLGVWIAFDGAFPVLPPEVGSIVTYLCVYAALFAIVGGGLYLTLRWFKAVTAEPARTAVAADAHVAWWPAFIALSLLFTGWLTVLFQARDVLQLAAGSGATSIGFIVLPLAPFLQAVPIALVALTGLAVYPLMVIPAMRFKAPQQVPMFIDHPTGVALLSPPQTALSRTLVTAVIGAAGYLLAVGLARWAIGSTAHMSDNQILLLFAFEACLAIAAQACVAVMVASNAPVMPVHQGFGAAYLAGALMAVAVFFFNVAVGGQPAALALVAFFVAILIVGSAGSAALANLTTALSKPLPRT